MSRSHQTARLVRWPRASHHRPIYRIALKYPTTGWPGHRWAAALQCSAQTACSVSESAVSGAATRPRPHVGIDLRAAALRATPRHNLEMRATPRRDTRPGHYARHTSAESPPHRARFVCVRRESGADSEARSAAGPWPIATVPGMCCLPHRTIASNTSPRATPFGVSV